MTGLTVWDAAAWLTEWWPMVLGGWLGLALLVALLVGRAIAERDR